MKDYSRRRFIKGVAAIAAISATAKLVTPSAFAQATGPGVELPPYPDAWLPAGIRSRYVNKINGLRVHVLEAGYETANRPALLLLHGFPELAYSWRNVMPALAQAGYHVIVPDVRGYGRTTGWSADYNADLAPFRSLNKVRDALGLINAFGYKSVAGGIGHDAGSPLAGWCALARPDVFRSVVMMSAPFGAPADLPFDTANQPSQPAHAVSSEEVSSKEVSNDIYADLAALPRPRKHYQRYYTTAEANANMWQATQGIRDFIRAYYHFKSADWKGNQPFPLAARTAAEWAKMPEYYIMDVDKGMAETVAPFMPTPVEIAANTWLTDRELQVYVEEYGRTGFQGGLNGYRMGGSGAGVAEQELYAGRKIDQPSLFISGASDWGTYQSPGSLERMRDHTCTDMRAVHLVAGAGHWVQQEQAAVTSTHILDFLNSIG